MTAKPLNDAEKKAHVAAIDRVMKSLYPDAVCSLEHKEDPFRLLVMARLSAQCTDARVNIVSEELFRMLPDAKAMAEAPIETIEELIRPCGLFHTKAKNIRDMSQMLLDRFGGQVPSGMDELLSLPGVGRKIANLIRGDHFGLGGIVADTHCIRLSGRFGLTDGDDPVKVERTLDALVPKSEQSDYCHRMVYFGRDYCRAASPRCDECPLKKEDPALCRYEKPKK